jgi:hypothetical protein
MPRSEADFPGAQGKA